MKAKFALIGLLAAGVACGPAASVPTQPATASTEAARPTAPAATENSTTSSPESPYGDVASFNACEIVPPQDVADLIGGPLFRDLPQQPSPNCTYEVVAGPTDYSQWTVYIQPTDWVEPLIENAPETLGEPIPNMGDQAFLNHDEATDTYDLLVLVRNQFGLEVVGDGKDWTLAIGDLFLSRMLGP